MKSPLTALYCTGEDALEWEVDVIDYAVLRERLRPNSVAKPSAQPEQLRSIVSFHHHVDRRKRQSHRTDTTMTPTPQSPDPKNLVGIWKLTGFVEEDAGDRSGSDSIIFNDTSLYAPESVDSASGEELTVSESGGDVLFTMRGGAQVSWTSAEKEQGVLENTIEDQDGRVVSSLDPYFRLERKVKDHWVSKYSDSDLDMDNVAFLDGNDLVLMVTTIVDELYVTKYFYRFSRV